MQLIQAIRTNVRLLLRRCNIPYKVISFDGGLYQECIDDGIRRGYPMDDNRFLQSCLRTGVVYARTFGAHLPHRPTQIWIAHYTSCLAFVDDMGHRFPSELPNLHLFNDRFIRREPHMNSILNAFADVIRRTSDLHQPVASQLIATSTLNFVAGNLLEHETRSMKISGTAQHYPTYRRRLSGAGEAYSFMMFPKEIPLNDYIQAIPNIIVFLENVNDILSFYKEERAGDPTNQISTLAVRTEKTELETLSELTEATIEVYKKTVKILGGSPKACEAFKRCAAGYVYFHTSAARYRMDELDL